MTVGAKNPKLEKFFTSESNKWRAEMQALREIMLSLPLSEEMKWGQACYTHGKDRNIAIIHGFKEYCGLSFMKGALMKDPAGLLIQPTENMQAGRQIRFTGLDQITGHEDTIKAYVADAIAIEESGRQVPKKETKDFPVPDELRQKFAEDPAYKEAFEALTPGRQRGWLLHFAGAKQSATRASRIEKAREKIFDRLGPMD
jgi:uncharacterized protein YdeI (YjbR/CyaY-like superfamily)